MNHWLKKRGIRFTPDQLIHIKVGDDRKTFYPYGPAHQLRLIEDAVVVHRLTRAPNKHFEFGEE